MDSGIALTNGSVNRSSQAGNDGESSLREHVTFVREFIRTETHHPEMKIEDTMKRPAEPQGPRVSL
jgi:hypothetical protein